MNLRSKARKQRMIEMQDVAFTASSEHSSQAEIQDDVLASVQDTYG